MGSQIKTFFHISFYLLFEHVSWKGMLDHIIWIKNTAAESPPIHCYYKLSIVIEDQCF